MKIDLLGGYNNDVRQGKIIVSSSKTEVNTGKQIEESIKNSKYNKNYVNEAIKKLKQAGDIFNRRLDFRVDEATKRIVVKVIDTETDKVIKEIPPEQLIRLAARIQEMIGLLVDEER